MGCRIPHWIALKRLNLLKNHFQSSFQLLFRSRLSLCLSEVRIVCDCAAIVIGRLHQQFRFLNSVDGHTLILRYETLLQLRQLDCCVVLSFLNMVPDKLICHPRGLFLGKFSVLTSRIVADGKPLTAFAADNSFHKN
jgi:hypothetical protein